MRSLNLRVLTLTAVIFFGSFSTLRAQDNFKMKYKNSYVYAGIEVGSKGVKISCVEIGRNAKANGAFNPLKDSSVNTDFISFNESTYDATLNELSALYSVAAKDYNIPSDRIFTVISSGVKGQADKENKNDWIEKLIGDFKSKINEPARNVEVIDVLGEARLSHLGIVPDEKRYNTFLIDIGSGNAKGGYFPYGNTQDFKLFGLNWGTKSTANATEKACGDDNSIENYHSQLKRVLSGIENGELIYAVNSSGAYPVSDNIAFSGGIAWAAATLMHPEMAEQAVIPVSYRDVVEFSEALYNDYDSFSDQEILKRITDKSLDPGLIARNVKTVNKVFDKKAMLAGTGLMLKIMRQFESIYKSKDFFLVKNGQVGWISAYVNEQNN
jgi:hypothetical protein